MAPKKFQGRFAKKPRRFTSRKPSERKELERSLEDEGLDPNTEDLTETETELINRFIAEMGLPQILKAPRTVFQRWAGSPSRKQLQALQKIQGRLMRPGERAAPPVPRPKAKPKPKPHGKAKSPRRPARGQRRKRRR